MFVFVPKYKRILIVSMATFSNALQNLLDRTGMKRAELFRVLRKRGAAVSRSTLYEYLAGSQVPSADKAQEILEALHIEYTLEQLYYMLSESQTERSTVIANRYEKGLVLSGGHKIRLRNCSSRIGSDEDIEKALRVRIDETAESFNDYLTKLIKKDIDEQILERKRK